MPFAFRRILKLLAVPALAAAALLPALPASAATPVTVTGVWLSTYTWWNNSPAGCGIEYAHSYGYPTIDECAGNSVNNAPGRTGAYNDPITFASQNSGVFNYPPGTIVYVPYFAKYFILEDLCSTCYTAQPQMDLWLGGVSQSQESDQSSSNMVNLWTQKDVIVNPPANEPVNTSQLSQANALTGLSGGGGGPVSGHITMTTTPSKCMDDTNNGTANGTRMRIWDCTSLPTTWTVGTDGTITFSGKCMEVSGQGTANGSAVDLYTCNGGSNQKWTYTGGTLVGVQSGKCLDDPGGVLTNGTQLDIYTCNGSNGQKWTLPA
jgi:hypothetical protein